MNASYDKSLAVAALETAYTAAIRTEDEPPFLQDVKAIDYTVKQCQDAPWLKVVERDAADGVVEAMFRIRGVVCVACLPPVKNRGKQNAKKSTRDLLNLKQMITITGLGSPSFAKNIARLDEIMNVLYNSTGSVEVAPLEIVAYEGHPTVHAQNRYFTERKVAPNLQSLPFLPGVDDYRVLQQYDPQNLLHTKENRVEYVTSFNGKRENIHPKEFKAGDIVELIISIAAVPIKNNRLKAFLVLRGVCLLDPSIRTRSVETALPSFAFTSGPSIRMKRKLVYLSEEDQDLAKRLKESHM